MGEKRALRHWLWAATLALLWIMFAPPSAYENRERTVREQALFQALEQENHAQTEALLRSGVPVDARRHSTPYTPWEPLQNFQLRREYPNYRFQIGYTPLMIASIRGDVWEAKLLLDRGVDMEASVSGRRPWSWR